MQAEEIKEAEKNRKIREAADLLEFKADYLPKWLAGENIHLPYVKAAYLRVVGDTCETSQGATVPLAHVQRAMPLIARMANIAVNNGEVVKPEHDIRLGHYRLDRFEADGTVVIGCHRFEHDEVRRIAAMLKDLPIADRELATA